MASSAEPLDSVARTTSDLSLGGVLLTPPASPSLEVPSFGLVLAGVGSEVPGESPAGGGCSFVYDQDVQSRAEHYGRLRRGHSGGD